MEKFELKVEYIDRKTEERHELGTLHFKTKDEVLDYILLSQKQFRSEFFYPEFTLYESI